jgi:feruloyl esterase
VSIWHGGADKTVIPVNAEEIIKQWTDVHGLPGAPSFEETVDGYPRRAWLNSVGEPVVESYSIPSMAHGTPLHSEAAGGQWGAPGPFLLDVGISSSYHIAKFWGLTDATHVSAPLAANAQPKSAQPEPQPAREPHGSDAAHSTGSGIEAIIRKALRAAGLLDRGPPHP